MAQLLRKESAIKYEIDDVVIPVDPIQNIILLEISVTHASVTQVSRTTCDRRSLTELIKETSTKRREFWNSL